MPILRRFLLSLCAVALVPAGSTRAEPVRTVSYAKDVKVILAHHCYECHGKGKTKGGLSMLTRESFLKGGKAGAGAVPGKPDESILVRRLLSKDPDEVMPPADEPRLSAEQIATLKAWVAQGLPWDEIKPEALVSKPKNVTPRRFELPAGQGQPVDRILTPYFAKHEVAVKVVDDRTYARRLYLDIVGLPPMAAELADFLADTSPDKRARLADKLLADSDRYADHWITFWQDHLRDGMMDLGSTDIVRPITPWLLKALKDNRPYDEMVRQLVNPQVPKNAQLTDVTSKQDDDVPIEKDVKVDDTDSFGFIQGLRAGLEKPRGDQRWEVQAVQNISQVFLGTNLKCATCHDSFIDYWTMKDTWGLASVYADKPLEVIRCEVPQGVHPAPSFLFSEVGAIDAKAPVAERKKQLAELVTSPKNGRFARTVVNRLWTRLMGVGIIDPVDDMDHPPFSADLMDYLATQLVDGGHDLKKIIRLIVTSQAYQLPAIDPKKAPANIDGVAEFRGPMLRRMTGEQFVDAGNAIQGRPTRVWVQKGGRLLEILGRPDRRTVTTGRDHKSSPMQALELLNGPSLYELIYLEPQPNAPRSTDTKTALKKEAEKPKPNAKLAALAKLPPKELITQIYTHALSRPPTDKELAVQMDLLGSTPTPESVGDMLWVVVNLPEFQLIR
ncbi:MAG TPA: PSD1 and planctomycete cytochrome C domain-containing protein [Tepidisphaeraceae bacterium]|nr:PSD1 and planctomycete cytochrome C domain-containing protein [Tepidisphaeraceae bacterium]